MKSDADLRAAFALATVDTAQALGLENYGLRTGNPADLVVFREASVPEAIVSHTPRVLVIKGGRIGYEGPGRLWRSHGARLGSDAPLTAMCRIWARPTAQQVNEIRVSFYLRPSETR